MKRNNQLLHYNIKSNRSVKIQCSGIINLGSWQGNVNYTKGTNILFWSTAGQFNNLEGIR
jgi:hypothetical protein